MARLKRDEHISIAKIIRDSTVPNYARKNLVQAFVKFLAENNHEFDKELFYHISLTRLGDAPQRYGVMDLT